MSINDEIAQILAGMPPALDPKLADGVATVARMAALYWRISVESGMSEHIAGMLTQSYLGMTLQFMLAKAAQP